jgi:O-methyltransferase involved in polyketide biosynthesis
MSKSLRSSEKVSPTAYATGNLWVRLGLSHPVLSTPQGRRLDKAFSLLMRAIGGRSFGTLMYVRHVGIDAQLAHAIKQGRVGTVIEIAAGLSGRGIRMMKRYGKKIEYIETDLPNMVALKRERLEKANLLSKRHRVVVLNALADKGEDSLAELVKTLDKTKGVAIITEGLLNYLNHEEAQGVWTRIAKNLKLFPHGLYLADAYLMRGNRSLPAIIFGAVLSTFVRGRMYVHFKTMAHGIDLMRKSGFRSVALHEPRSLPETRIVAARPGGDRVLILEAST